MIAPEVAEDEFNRMCAAMDLDLEDMDQEDQDSFEPLKKTVTKAILRGRVTVSELGLPTVTLKFPVGEVTQVAFKRPTGGTLVALGDTKSTNNITKTFAFLADLTGSPRAAFDRMDLKDFKLCQALTQLFLA